MRCPGVVRVLQGRRRTLGCAAMRKLALVSLAAVLSCKSTPEAKPESAAAPAPAVRESATASVPAPPPAGIAVSAMDPTVPPSHNLYQFPHDNPLNPPPTPPPPPP